MYAAKAVKYLSTRNGVAVTARVTRDGVKVADIENRGDGGATTALWVAAGERDAFLAWAGSVGLGSVEEWALDGLLTWAENDKLSAGAVVVRLDEGDDLDATDMRTVKVPSGMARDALVAEVARRLPRARVWDTATHSWLAPIAA